MPQATENFRKFSISDALIWKFLPVKFGGGANYLLSYKDAWVSYNKTPILNAAHDSQIPAILLAGVAWTEVGGKDFTDYPVFYFRSFDWAGPDWVDTHMTVTKNPALTSMGAVSIQLRRAAETIGLDMKHLTQAQLDSLANTLQSDVANLNIVAAHLRKLILIDNPGLNNSTTLTDEQIRLAGTRYFYGPEASKETIATKAKSDGSYGSVILKHKERLRNLLY